MTKTSRNLPPSPLPLSLLPRGRRQKQYVSIFANHTNTTTYDYLWRAASIRQTSSAVDEIFAEFEHNANGLLTSVNRYEVDDNDVVTSIANSLYTYNAANAITSITHKKPDATPIVQHSYTYDETNNIVEYLNSLDGQTSYDYDFLGQLIGADYANTGLTDESYTYDENGNRITANGDDYTTGTNNELTSDSKWTYTYDDEGNRLSKQNSTSRELYEWDYRNRLTKVTQQEYNSTTEEWTTTQIVEYTYDYNNVWIRKSVGTNSTIFIPENYQTTVQIDNGIVTHHYLWTPQHQDKLLADTTTSGILWTLTDHLGTVRDIIQQTSSCLVVPAHIIYDAYGNQISCTDSTGQTVENPILFAYTGKAFDIDIQLQNNINRWYDSAVGHWLSIDPIGFEGNDTNLYRYVSNTPILLIDFHGKTEEKDYWNDDCGCPGPYSGEYLILAWAETERQNALVKKMRDALKECTICNTDLQIKALANFDQLIQMARQQSAGSRGLCRNRCMTWVNAMYDDINALKNNGHDLQIPDVIELHSFWYPYTWWFVPAMDKDTASGKRIGNIANFGHAFIRVTLCKKYVFYLDRGNWGHIFDDSRIKRPIVISSQSPFWGHVN